MSIASVCRFSGKLQQDPFFRFSGDLQGPEKVFEAGVRGGVVGPGQHGHHRRLLHLEGHQG